MHHPALSLIFLSPQFAYPRLRRALYGHHGPVLLLHRQDRPATLTMYQLLTDE